LGVVIAPPLLEQDAGFVQRREHRFIQQLVAKPGVEALDEGVLPGHSRRDGIPFDQNKATVGNGTMVAFRASTWREVDDFHAAALANGGQSEGAPGLRPHYAPDFYAAYARDPDGNKIAALCRGIVGA